MKHVARITASDCLRAVSFFQARRKWRKKLAQRGCKAEQEVDHFYVLHVGTGFGRAVGFGPRRGGNDGRFLGVQQGRNVFGKSQVAPTE